MILFWAGPMTKKEKKKKPQTIKAKPEAESPKRFAVVPVASGEGCAAAPLFPSAGTPGGNHVSLLIQGHDDLPGDNC